MDNFLFRFATESTVFFFSRSSLWQALSLSLRLSTKNGKDIPPLRGEVLPWS